VIIHENERRILQIIFYSGEEVLVKVGGIKDDVLKHRTGRVEVFKIEDDEVLIGCKIDEG
jgi:hypothetical protein